MTKENLTKAQNFIHEGLTALRFAIELLNEEGETSLSSAISLKLSSLEDIESKLQYKSKAMESSTLLKQFYDLKAKHPDALLLFRCGDFYESYEQDAKELAETVGITLTKESKTGIRMAGFPYHALDCYLPKLIRTGHRVAICEQLVNTVNPK